MSDKPVESAKSPFSPERRDFLKKASFGAGLLSFPSILGAASHGAHSPNGKLNVAFVGVGGKGTSAIDWASSENLVAFCDVDMGRVAKARENAEFNEILTNAEKHGAKWFRDYREMLSSMGDSIDAVVISTPDHMHYPIALSAINAGKHVYCEKPLTHTVEEARLLTEAARKAGVVTQMGNQGHSHAGLRLIREWVEAGVIGKVTEVSSWTNRPIWPQGLKLPDHSKMIPVVPNDLSWDLWLGIAEPRAYDPAYLPFSWRGWWDFGCGALGDMGCHIMDAAYWSMQLDNPDWVEATATWTSEHACPNASVVTYQFPARGKFPPIKYTWYDGGLRPPLPAMLKEWPEMARTNGTFIIGEEAVIVSDTYARSVSILPDEKFEALKPKLPPRTLPRVKGSHMENFLDSIRAGEKAVSDFEYAGPFSEMVLLGNVAIRAGKRIEYDHKRMKITNMPEANRFLTKDYRPGWIL